MIKALWLMVPPIFAVAIAGLALKAFRKRAVLDTMPEVAGAKSVQNGTNEEILVFVGGRLFDRFAVSDKAVHLD